MSTLQIRDIPEDVKQVLKVRAAKAGQSLSDYALAELTRIATRPSLDELTERLRHRGSVETATSAADILRAERDAR